MARRTILQFSLATLLIFSLLCGAAMTWWYGRYARWAANLAVPELRDEALFNLLHNQRVNGKPGYEETIPASLAECRVNHVLISPQLSGPPVYLVFKETSYDKDTGPGIPRGHVILFDGNGYFIPWHSGGNSLSGQVLVTQPGAPLICVDTIPYSHNPVLYVLEISQRRQPILEVAYKPTAWSWRVSKTQDEIAIELGPESGLEEQIVPKARYVWSNTSRTFTGPEGGMDQAFMRMKPSWTDADLRQFSGKTRAP